MKIIPTPDTSLRWLVWQEDEFIWYKLVRLNKFMCFTWWATEYRKEAIRLIHDYTGPQTGCRINDFYRSYHYDINKFDLKEHLNSKFSNILAAKAVQQFTDKKIKKLLNDTPL